jgi:predicted signal transduction protein with EAL and GGDEF domain
MRAIGQRRIHALATPFSIAGQEVFVPAAVGTGMYPLHAATPEALFRCADAAMYRAKRLGLKIDRSFVARLPQARDARAGVEAVLSLSRSLGLNNIPEGVETEEQADWLRQAGCAELQGFLYARPMPAAALTALPVRPPLAIATME